MGHGPATPVGRGGAEACDRGATANRLLLLSHVEGGTGELDLDGVAHFRALRHTFGTNLARAAVPVNVAMDLMRHSDVNLTMRLYSHTVIGDRAKALESLPDLTKSHREPAHATGAADASPGALENLASRLAQSE